jgi:beta-1,4-mannosyl-glycoprotein beta-1,4-N-acetylglucosaminyltransferase
MIIDTTLFNDEFHMLDIRLALTQSWVDRWVVCEGNRTMSGRPKPYHLSQNLHHFQQFRDRLTVIKLDIPEHWTNWDIENGQRSALLPGYQHCDPDDVIIHSDLDELINPDLVPNILDLLEQHNRPVTCTLDMYVYRFDQKVNRAWAGPVVARRRHFQDPCTLYKGVNAGVGHAQKRKDRSHCVPFPGVSGWHWGWIGDDHTIQSKVLSCIETQHRDPQEIVNHLHQMDTVSAINHKCVTTWDPDPGYPNSVLQVIKQYPYWT